MKCTYYRPESINSDEWTNIRDKMKYDLFLLKEESFDFPELRCYLERLLPQAMELDGVPEMLFFGLGNPRSMPSDIRVEFFYWPTYIATTFCMKAILFCPDVIDAIGEDMGQINGEETLHILAKCMRGCTGRKFNGHGFDEMRGLIDVMDFFTEHCVQQFVDKYPMLCPEFTECFEKAVDLLSGLAKNEEALSLDCHHRESLKVILNRLS